MLSLMRGAITRITVSILPPGGTGITMRMGFTGKPPVCADAIALITENKPITAIRLTPYSSQFSPHNPYIDIPIGNLKKNTAKTHASLR